MRVHQRKRQTEHNDERIMEFFMQVTKRQLLLHRGSKTAMNYVPIQKCIKNNRSLMTMAEQDYNQ